MTELGKHNIKEKYFLTPKRHPSFLATVVIKNRYVFVLIDAALADDQKDIELFCDSKIKPLPSYIM